MKLVMVHGRGQKGLDPQTLRKEWLRALGEGLSAAKRKLSMDTVIEFPFYGDELERLVQEAKGPPDPEELAFRVELLTEIARAAGISEAEIAPRRKGIQNWRWIGALLRALDRIPGVNSGFIDLFTRDVYVYLTRPAVRKRIDALVDAALGDGACVVLAHSLGTIVAYNVLGQRTVGKSCPRLITVGSPLGVRAIKRHLRKPLVSPPCVAHWFNALDKRDVVALYPLDDQNFKVDPAVENKTDVRNRTENRHGIAGYLEDAVVAAKVVEFL